MNKAIAIILMFSALAAPFVAKAITGNDIWEALDSPEGVTFSNPGKYPSGASAAWTVNTGTIPQNPDDIDGTVTWTGSSCLIGTAPSGFDGFEGYLNTRKRSYFTMTVQGTGYFSFDYRTSLDWPKDSQFLVYSYAGDNAKALQVDDADSPTDTTERTTLDYHQYFRERNNCWDKKAEKWGETEYGLAASAWWLTTKHITLGTDAYTHVITFAIVGAAKSDRFGTPFSSTSSDKVFDTQVFEWRIYLDNLVWVPEPEEMAPQIITFLPADGTKFKNRLSVIPMSDYDDGVFRFFYTLDGSTPTLQSPEWTTYQEDIGTVVDPIELTQTTTITVGAYENATKQFVKYASATYYLNPLLPPAISWECGEPFSDQTTLTFTTSYTGEGTVRYHYTLDGSEPGASSPSTTGTVTLPNSALDGKTLKVVTSDGSLFSDATAKAFRRTAKPVLSWTDNGQPTTNLVADGPIEVTATGTAKQTVTLQPADGHLAETGTVRAVARESGCLDSEIVSQQLQITSTALPLSYDALASDLTRRDGWAIFALPGGISDNSAQLLTAWLQPYCYDASAQRFCVATAITSGEAYWVYLPQVDFEQIPAVKYSPASAVSAPESVWRLVPADAEFFWDGNIFIPAPNDTLPGWKK